MIRRRFVALTGASLTVATAARVRAADPSAGRFAVAGGTLGYRRFGENGPIHVLLSGGPGLEPFYVEPIAVELARERTIVVLDQRGTGTSREAMGDGSQLTVAGAVDDLDGLRAALGLKRLSLLGHSWGAMLSMAYAAAHPERVSALGLLDPGGPDIAFAKAFSDIISVRLTPQDTAAINAAQSRREGTLRYLVPGYFHDHAKGLAYAATWPARYSNPGVNPKLFADMATHYDVKAALRGTKIPTLTVYGVDDPSRAAESALDALFPQATKVMVADAGHFPWIENPAPFYAAIRAFLTGPAAST